MAEGMREVAALPDPVGRGARAHVSGPTAWSSRRPPCPWASSPSSTRAAPTSPATRRPWPSRAGSACVLRGGKEAFRSANAIVDALRRGLQAAGLPEAAGQPGARTPPAPRANELMTAVGLVDLLIPRGGAGLIRACVENATVPVHPDRHRHLPRLCGRGRRPGHGAGHHRKRQDQPPQRLQRRGGAAWCTRTLRRSFCPSCSTGWWTGPRGTGPARRWSCGWMTRAAAIIAGTPAGPKDFDTEFLDYILAVEVVDSVEEAIAHIAAPLHRPQRGHRHRANESAGRPLHRSWWTARRSMSTPPPASPTAASSAWAARWASPPRSSTPAAPWGCRSCAAINTSSMEMGRCGEGNKPLRRFARPFVHLFSSMDCFFVENSSVRWFECVFRLCRWSHPSFRRSPQNKSHTSGQKIVEKDDFSLDKAHFGAVQL